MTNLVNKQHLIAALDRVGEGLNLNGVVCDILASMGGDQKPAAYNKGAAHVLNALVESLIEGKYDASDEDVLAECAVVRYSEDVGEDTEDMDDLAPEEESVVLGIIMLPPCPSPAEAEELKRWYEEQGYITKKNG